MQNYEVDNKVHVLDSEEFERLLPQGAVKITQTEADILSAPPPETPEEANIRKDIQDESELGSDVVRIIIETIVPMIQDGSITSMTPNDVIVTAKANRRAEL